MGLRWGLLSCARICRRGLIPGILASKTGTLAALASRDGSQARAWAEEFSIPRSYGSYDELLADPEIDAVYVPLPNELHKPWVERAADAGKHVLCEKPLALTADEAAAMVEYCRSRKVLLMEAFMWRHQPRTLAVKKMVEDGKIIGRLRLVRSSFSFPIDPGDWRLDPKRGGGALWDVGCYGVSAARLFAGGEPDQVRAVANKRGGVDMSLAAVLEFPGGVLASVDCSFEQPFRCRCELVGERGVIEIPDTYLPPAAGPIAMLRTMAEPSDVGAGDDRTETLTFANVNQYAAMVDAFNRSVAAGRLETPAEDGLLQMKTLDAIRRAAY